MSVTQCHARHITSTLQCYRLVITSHGSHLQIAVYKDNAWRNQMDQNVMYLYVSGVPPLPPTHAI